MVFAINYFACNMHMICCSTLHCTDLITTKWRICFSDWTAPNLTLSFYYLSRHQEWIKTKTDDTATFSEQPFLCNYSYNSDKGCGGG